MKTATFALAIAVLSLIGAPSRAKAAGKDDAAVARRIKDVENGLVAFTPGAPAVTPQTRRTRTLTERMAFYKVPGVSIALINQNRIEWARSYGVLEAGGAAPVTPDSLFEAASTTKAIVAAIVLRLVQEGRLDLDADVNEYLRSWHVANNEFTGRQKVTLRLLLSHRAGLPATNFPCDEKAAPPSLLQVLEGQAPAGNKAAVVEFLPGSKWQYSNIGYVVVQQVLEDVSKEPLEQIAREKVFMPLGMASSTFVYPLTPGWRKREALPHDETGAAAAPAMHPAALAQGGLMTTPSDLARFTCELLRAKGGRAWRLLAPATVRQMLRRQVDIDPRIFGYPVAEGLGLFVRGSGRGLSFSHPGQNFPGTTSWLLAYPESGQGVVVMTNGAKGDLLTLEIIPALAAVYGWPADR